MTLVIFGCEKVYNRATVEPYGRFLKDSVEILLKYTVATNKIRTRLEIARGTEVILLDHGNFPK